MSGYTWKLIDWFKTNKGKSSTRLAINSNLGTDVDINRLLESIQGVDVEIYTSMEATGVQAEYIRDGLVYQDWKHNVERLLAAGVTVHFMATINALCLESLTDHLDYLLDLKGQYGRDQVNFTLNILRFPSFQSPLVLDPVDRTHFKLRLQSWLNENANSPLLHEHEVNHTQRLIDYLDIVKTPHSDAFEMPKLHNDFKQFYLQYDTRRNKDFVKTFPIIAEWYETCL
jgi:hypothetical protein